MSNETAFVLAMAITLALSIFLILYLRRPLSRILTDLCGSAERAGFWVSYADIVLLLVPLAVLMFGHIVEPRTQSAVFLIVGYLQWALLGMIGAVFMIALGVAAFILPSQSGVFIDPSQADDLRRLLAKVQELRAQELVGRTTTANG